MLHELEGSYGLLVKSFHYPGEVCGTRKGSPLLVGVKTDRKLKVDFVDVEFENNASGAVAQQQIGQTLSSMNGPNGATAQDLGFIPVAPGEQNLRTSQSRAFLSEDDLPTPVEFFFEFRSGFSCSTH